MRTSYRADLGRTGKVRGPGSAGLRHPPQLANGDVEPVQEVQCLFRDWRRPASEVANTIEPDCLLCLLVHKP